MKKYLFSALAMASVGLTSVAHASFELLLVADQGDGAAGSSRIHRFDPQSRAYLGSFGSGVLTAVVSVTVDQTAGLAYVKDVNGYHAFDYSTGNHLRHIATNNEFYNNYIRLIGGYLVGTGLGTPRLEISTSNLVTLPTPNNGYSLSVAPAPGSTAYVTEYTVGSTNRLYRYNPSTNAYTLLGSAATNSAYYSDGITLGRFRGGPGAAVVYGRGGDGDLGYWQLNAAGSVVSNNNVNLNAINSVFGLANAHDGLFALGRLATDVTKYGITYVSSQGTEFTTFGTSFLTKPISMASVVAPEPGTLLALGAGLVALVRRRRNR